MTDNTFNGLKKMLADLRNDFKCTGANTILFVEDMGIYNQYLRMAAKSKRFVLMLCAPLSIKRSLGVLRGKTDKIDAIRIAKYGSLNFKQLKECKPVPPAVDRLKCLSRIRRKILKARTLLEKHESLEKYFLPPGQRKELNGYILNSLTALNNDLEEVNTKISQTIQKDKNLNHIFELITSVPNVGRVVATEIIITTNAFQKTFTAKTFASYCGVAPFPWESGTSISGKRHVSFYANKQLKNLLHMAAMVSIRTNSRGFIKDYYERKVAEGKNKMSVLNAIRCKLISRIFSCVKADKMFTEVNVT